ALARCAPPSGAGPTGCLRRGARRWHPRWRDRPGARRGSGGSASPDGRGTLAASPGRRRRPGRGRGGASGGRGRAAGWRGGGSGGGGGGGGVGGGRAGRGGEDDGARAGDQVAGEQQPLGGEQEAEVVGGVARGLEGDEAKMARLDRITVAERMVHAADRR